MATGILFLSFVGGSYESPAALQDIRETTGIVSRTNSAVRPGESSETLSKLIRLRNRLRKFRPDWSMQDGRGVLKGVTAELGKGQVTARGLVDYTIPTNPHHLTFQIRDSEAMALLDILLIRIDGKILGRFNADTEFRWTGLRLREMKSTVRGPVRFQSASGQILRVGIIEQFYASLGLDGGGTVAYESVDLQGSASDGWLRIEKGSARTADFRAELTLSLDLLTENFQASVIAFLPTHVAARSERTDVREFAAKNRDSRTECPVRVNFSGSLTNPKVDSVTLLPTQGVGGITKSPR